MLGICITPTTTKKKKKLTQGNIAYLDTYVPALWLLKSTPRNSHRKLILGVKKKGLGSARGLTCLRKKFVTCQTTLQEKLGSKVNDGSEMNWTAQPPPRGLGVGVRH